jgi:hypothetical protein
VSTPYPPTPQAEQEAAKKQASEDEACAALLTRWAVTLPAEREPIAPELLALVAGPFRPHAPTATPLARLLRLLLLNDSFLVRTHKHRTALHCTLDATLVTG